MTVQSPVMSTEQMKKLARELLLGLKVAHAAALAELPPGKATTRSDAWRNVVALSKTAEAMENVMLNLSEVEA